MKPVTSTSVVLAALMALMVAAIPASLVLADLGVALAMGPGGGGGGAGAGGSGSGGDGTGGGMGGGMGAGSSGGMGGPGAGSSGGMGSRGGGMGTPANGLSSGGMGQAGMNSGMSDRDAAMGGDAGQGHGHMGRGSEMATSEPPGSPETMGRPGTSTAGMRSNGQSMNALRQDMTREREAQRSEMTAEDHDIAGARDRESHP